MSSARILRALDAGAMLAIAMQMHRDERIAVASYLGTDAPDAGPSAAAYCTDRTVNLPSMPKDHVERLEPQTRQRALSTGRGRRTARRRRAEPDAQVGLRLRGRRHRVRRAHGHRRPDVRRQRGRARACAACRERLLAMGLPSERPRARGDRRGASRRPACAAVRRPDRMVLRRARRDRRAVMEDADRDPRLDTPHGGGSRARRRDLRARVIVGRVARRRSRVRVLHFSRQRRGAAARGRRTALEDLHDGRAEGDAAKTAAAPRCSDPPARRSGPRRRSTRTAVFCT